MATKFDYTYAVQKLLPESGSMLVEYTPTDTTLTKITYNIPIRVEMDINDIAGWVDNFAPQDKWYAQHLILNSSHILLGSA
jgi:hypothetical protein